MNHHLFTIGNPKTLKGEARGWLTAVLHLAPARSSGVMNVCPKATPGCIELCLNTAGRGGIGLTTVGDNATQAARRRKTALYHENKAEFVRLCVEELEHWNRHAHNRGLKLAIRMNGTSDLLGLTKRVYDGAWHLGRFYDYTKVFGAWEKNPGVHYTFSRSEDNRYECAAALQRGHNVAVVFNVKRGDPLPESYRIPGYRDHRVIDGDEHDLRFLDKECVIVGLRAKGRARTTTSPFVVRVAA